MKIFKILCFVLMMVSSLIASADESSTPDTIKSIQTGWGGEGIYITTDSQQLLDGCTNNVFYVNARNVAMVKEILTVALSAFHARSKVIFRVSGCEHGRMRTIAIAIVSN